MKRYAVRVVLLALVMGTAFGVAQDRQAAQQKVKPKVVVRSEEHTSELQSPC